MSVKHGTTIEVQTEKCTCDELASSHKVFPEPGTFYARANQSNQITSRESSGSSRDDRVITFSRERSGSSFSATSGQSFSSTASVFSIEESDRPSVVGGQYHTSLAKNWWWILLSTV